MADRDENHPILDDPYAKTPNFTWFEVVFLLIIFFPFAFGVDITLAVSIALYTRAGYELFRKIPIKSVLIHFIGATIFLISWLFLVL